MNISYDPKYNIAYIKLREKTAKVETIRISDELNVDITPDGKVYGIELLDANNQLALARKKGTPSSKKSNGKIVRMTI